MSRDAADTQDFSPYAQLVAALLPRAAGLSIFHPDGELRWTSEEAVPSQLPGLIAQAVELAVLNEDSGERVQLGASEPVYLFWLRGEDRKPTAVLSVRWRTTENEPRTFSYVHAMLRPVIDCLKRELQLLARLEAAGAAAPNFTADSDAENADLKVLLTTTEALPSGGGDVAQLLGHINTHMKCEFTALLMPERNLVVTSKAEGREVDTSMLARAHRQLLSLAQLNTEALLLNEPGSLPGVDLPLRALVSTVRNAAGRITAVLALFRSREQAVFRRRDGLLADLLTRRAATVIEARYDALTGLFTRQAFEPRVRTVLAERRAGEWSFLYIDADRLHAINESHGMQVGDRLLTKLGELVRSRLAPTGVAARIAGDRFAILLPATEADATNFAEGLRTAMAALSSPSAGISEAVQSSLSVGVAAVNFADAEPWRAMDAAEAACRAAKRHGRNRVERYEPDSASQKVHALGEPQEGDVRAAREILEGGRLCLHAQLIAPLPGNVAPKPHFELLLRVEETPDEPATSPGRFLGDAARLGLMREVDAWVVREALAQLAPRAPLLGGGAVVFTINLSGDAVDDAQFGAALLAQIQDSGIDPQALCFEVTEAAMLEHLAGGQTLLGDLRLLGCHIAMDDFGTGAASMTNLRALPLSMLKIDGRFVREMLSDPRVEGLVKGMIHVARSGGIATVAECVETEALRVHLGTLGVDYGQGFAIATPVPLADALRDLPTWASVVRQSQGSDVVLGEADDTVSAALQAAVRRELLANGFDPDAGEGLDPDLEAALRSLMPEALLAGNTAATPASGSDAEHGDGSLFSHRVAS